MKKLWEGRYNCALRLRLNKGQWKWNLNRLRLGEGEAQRKVSACRLVVIWEFQRFSTSVPLRGRINFFPPSSFRPSCHSRFATSPVRGSAVISWAASALGQVPMGALHWNYAGSGCNKKRGSCDTWTCTGKNVCNEWTQQWTTCNNLQQVGAFSPRWIHQSRCIAMWCMAQGVVMLSSLGKGGKPL